MYAIRSYYEVRSVLEDDEGSLWLGTEKGISKFLLPKDVYNISKDSIFLDSIGANYTYFLNYDENDGLQSGEFLSAALKTKSGKMYFGGTKGFNSFHPHDIVQNSYQPTVYFSELSLFNQPVSVKKGNDDESPLSYNFV